MEGNMNTKRVAGCSFIAFAIAILLSASPAHAHIAMREADLTPAQLEADKVLISNHRGPQSAVVCGIYFDFEQRMTIPGGPSQIALVDIDYPTGEANLYVGFSCADGYIIFYAGDCAC